MGKSSNGDVETRVVHDLDGKEIEVEVINGLMGCKVYHIGGWVYEMCEMKTVKVSDWDSNPVHSKKTAFGMKYGSKNIQFIMTAYCDHWDCGLEAIKYFTSRSIDKPVVCPAKSLEELGLK